MKEWYIGVMSGTSLDGIDLALVELDTPFCLGSVIFESPPLEPGSRSRLLAAIAAARLGLGELVSLQHLLGDQIGLAIEGFLQKNRRVAAEIRAIGMHGPTCWHQPGPFAQGDGALAGTLQLGDPHRVRARTGIPVIFDFRHADMAQGGEGAPLAPFLDHLLFRDRKRPRLYLNLGGIANLTLLPAEEGTVTAFDTGPANMVMDALMRVHPEEPRERDCEGAVAASGRVNPELLATGLKHPYFARRPPKSTGREEFGDSFLELFLKHRPRVPYADLLATATKLSAVTVAAAIRALDPRGRLGDLIVSGGGTHNRCLMSMLAEELPYLALRTTASLGLDPDGKEAVLMAVLAWAYCHGVPGNLPSVTGARRAVVLGSATA